MAPPNQKKAAKKVKRQARQIVRPPSHGPRRPNAGDEPGSPDPGPGPSPPPSAEDYGIPGLPPDVAARLDALNRQYPDHDVFLQKALAYLHTTPWFQNEYKGIDAGIAKGVLSGGLQSLSDYRTYENQIQQSFKATYGRAATKDEISSYLTLGYSIGHVQGMAQGHAYIAANQGNIQYATGAFDTSQLTAEELQAYGEEVSGNDSVLGQQIKARVEAALAKAQRVFAGQVGSSALGDAALNQNLQNSRKPDIAA